MWHYANSLCHGLKGAGLVPALATIFPYESLDRDSSAAVWSIGGVVPRAWSTGALRPFGRAINQCTRLLFFVIVLLRFRPQIIHFHNPLGQFDFAYYWLLRMLGIRVVFTAHDAQPLNGRRPNVFDRLRFNAADIVVVHASTDVRYLASVGIHGASVVQIPHGNYVHYCTPIIDRHEARSLINLPSDARIVLFFGAIEHYKGLDVLIEAFPTIKKAIPHASLVIAGAPVEDFTRYQWEIDALNLRGDVLTDLRYIPFEEMARYFCASEVVVLPYRQISQSGVLQLAYGFSRPVVVTDVGGLPELVATEGTGLVVPRGDVRRLAVAIIELLADRTRASAMGTRGRAAAESTHSWATVASRLAEVYDSRAKRPPPDADQRM